VGDSSWPGSISSAARNFLLYARLSTSVALPSHRMNGRDASRVHQRLLRRATTSRQRRAAWPETLRLATATSVPTRASALEPAVRSLVAFRNPSWKGEVKLRLATNVLDARVAEAQMRGGVGAEVYLDAGSWRDLTGSTWGLDRRAAYSPKKTSAVVTLKQL
jgi:hypothetical protein